jgi:hypothetical protein
MKSLEFYNDVYPLDQMQPEKVPRCIFVPSKEILRKIIRTATRCETKKDLIEKFGCA